MEITLRGMLSLQRDSKRAQKLTPEIARIIFAVSAIGLTQLIGWGTSFSMIAVLGSRIGADLGLSREVVFAGITTMLVVSGLLSPTFGRLYDVYGPRRQMAAGSLIAASSLVIMSMAEGPFVYLLSWAIFGVSMPMALSTTAVATVVQIGGAHARRAITGLTIIAGMTSVFFLPLGAWIEARYGWRTTILLYASLHILICLPLHLVFAPERKVQQNAAMPDPDIPWESPLDPSMRKRAFALIAIWSCCEGMLVWGFNMQAIDILQGLGLTLPAAVGVWMFSGPSQSSARVFELLFSSRYSIMTTAFAAAALAPLGFVLFYAAGVSVASASVMAVCYGLGHGFFAIARNVVPLRLFGLREFNVVMGRLALPQNLINGAAPVLYAALIGRVGAEAALWCSAAFAISSLGAVLMLRRVAATLPKPSALP
jgi:MFS family permease